MEAVETITYKGHELEIFYDEGYWENPNDWGNGIILVHYHRSFTITADEIITEADTRAWYNGEKIPQAKEYYIFAVKSYIHSGVVLALTESGKIFPDEQWDVSHVGLMLVKKTEAKSRKQAYKMAQNELTTWNSLIAGEVYGFKIDTGNSVWGFIGDMLYCIEAGKQEIDAVIEQERKQKLVKTKKYIKSKVPLSHRK